MISRRHIRIKVMQSLYSFFSRKGNEVANAERDMLKHFDEVVELKLVVISLLIEVVKYADSFYKEGKKKHLPTKIDLNPNMKFVKNQVISHIRGNKNLMSRLSEVSSIWLCNDHDVVRKLFNIIIKSDLYSKYLETEDMSSGYEKRFIIDLMNNYILKNELVHHILEERSIYWVDDLPFIAAIIFGEIKDDVNMNPERSFKDVSDKKFALDLFRSSIDNNVDYEKIIIKFAKNWDLDRIAKMDQLFLKMAFAEILLMPNLPIKVSMNEYIDISKYYSTSKSKLFVNGILDSFVKAYTKSGKIRKVGRGLI